MRLRVCTQWDQYLLKVAIWLLYTTKVHSLFSTLQIMKQNEESENCHCELVEKAIFKRSWLHFAKSLINYLLTNFRDLQETTYFFLRILILSSEKCALPSQNTPCQIKMPTWTLRLLKNTS